MTMDGYGTFGAFAKAYAAARRSFPDEIIEHLKERAGKRIHVLDMGCGTGIPSRQLADHGFVVIASDSDKRMIEKAKTDSQGYTIEYIVAPVHAHSFEDNTFDAVTAFSAFHWFTGRESLKEICRLLKKRGLFFVVNKNDKSEIKRLIKSTLAPFFSVVNPPIDVKASYDPRVSLEQHNFSKIAEYTVSVVDQYTIPDAIVYAQSISIWNLVIPDQRTDALEALRAMFTKEAHSGILERPLEIKAVSGYKSIW